LITINCPAPKQAGFFMSKSKENNQLSQKSFFSRRNREDLTVLHKPKITQPFKNIVQEAVFDRLKMTKAKKVSESELTRRMIGRYFELKVAQEIPLVLSINQFRTITNLTREIVVTVNNDHIIPDVFFYDVIGFRKTKPIFEFYAIGEIKGLSLEEGIELISALYKDFNSNKRKTLEAMKSGGFPLHHRDKYDQDRRVPLKFNPDKAEEWTRAIFSLFKDKSIKLKNTLEYCILLPADTYDIMILYLKNRRVKDLVTFLNQLFNQIGVNRIERMSYSRKEAEEFAANNLEDLKNKLKARLPSLSVIN